MGFLCVDHALRLCSIAEIHTLSARNLPSYAWPNCFLVDSVVFLAAVFIGQVYSFYYGLRLMA